jgi:hypothetical protein
MLYRRHKEKQAKPIRINALEHQKARPQNNAIKSTAKQRKTQNSTKKVEPERPNHTLRTRQGKLRTRQGKPERQRKGSDSPIMTSLTPSQGKSLATQHWKT